MNNLNNLKTFTDKYGIPYGTEDFSIFLYSWIKMHKPKNIVEYGTGLGSCMLWSGLACKENNIGKIFTIDNGSHWNEVLNDNILEKKYVLNYKDFINTIIKENNLENFIEFKNEDFNLETFNNIENKIDLVFFDFDHGPNHIVKILKNSLHRLSDYSTIIIDSVPTFLPSFLLLEKIIESFNLNIIFQSLNLSQDSIDFVLKSNFKLINIIENKDRNQNSFSVIMITPKDCFPQPGINVRY
jgi:predicted O-methyltransferase YrrM